MKEAKYLIEAWRQEYNESRPHRSLGDQTPSEFASQITASRDLTAIETCAGFFPFFSDAFLIS
jgi:putative transposase